MATSQGVKILGKDLEKTLAGLPLLVAHKEDEIPVLKVRRPQGFKIQVNTKKTGTQSVGQSSPPPSSVTGAGFQDDLVRELKQTLSCIKLEEKGVYVQASTLGSLEALLEFLRTSKVPVSTCRRHHRRGNRLQPSQLGRVRFPAVRRHQHRSGPQERRDEGVDDAGARPAVRPTVPVTRSMLLNQPVNRRMLKVSFVRVQVRGDPGV